jgi:hypothetical protein
MATWNGAVGGSETAVNAVLEQLFNALSTTSNLFKFGFEIDAAGLAKADIEITQAPVASFEVVIPSIFSYRIISHGTRPKFQNKSKPKSLRVRRRLTRARTRISWIRPSIQLLGLPALSNFPLPRSFSTILILTPRRRMMRL